MCVYIYIIYIPYVYNSTDIVQISNLEIKAIAPQTQLFANYASKLRISFKVNNLTPKKLISNGKSLFDLKVNITYILFSNYNL